MNALSHSREFYFSDQGSEARGPIHLDELRLMLAQGIISSETLILVGDEWLSLTQVSEIVALHDAKAAQPRLRGLTLFDIALVGGLWWWFLTVEWPAIGGLAFAVTAWTLGQVIAMVSQGILKLIGQYIQGFGGMIGLPAIIWLVWTMITKIFTD